MSGIAIRRLRADPIFVLPKFFSPRFEPCMANQNQAAGQQGQGGQRQQGQAPRGQSPPAAPPPQQPPVLPQPQPQVAQAPPPAQPLVPVQAVPVPMQDFVAQIVQQTVAALRTGNLGRRARRVQRSSKNALPSLGVPPPGDRLAGASIPRPVPTACKDV